MADREPTTAAFFRALEVLELCMGADLRENGCSCKPSGVCYFHAVTVPEAIRDLRAALGGDHAKA